MPRSGTTDRLNLITRHPLKDGAKRVGAVGNTINSRLPLPTPSRLFVQLLQFVKILPFSIVRHAQQPGLYKYTDNDVWLKVGVILGHHVNPPAALAGMG